MSECETLAMRDDARATASAMLAHEGGLHARPAIKVVQLAKRYASDDAGRLVNGILGRIARERAA